MEWIAKIPSWIRIPISILLPALAIFSGFIALANAETLEYLNLLKLRNNNGATFSIIFLVCVSLILCYCIAFVVNFCKKKIRTIMVDKNQYKLFLDLPDVYRNTLIAIYRQPTKSVSMELSNATANYLYGIKAIGPSSMTEFGHYCQFYLQPWVYHCIEKFISEHKQDIKYYEKKLKTASEEEKQTIIKELNILKNNLQYLTTENKEEDFD